MSEQRGWGLGESHLLPDAVVAFVDQELSLGAHERAAAHIAHCPGCAADVAAQRQARAAVQHAQAPSMSAGFLASLRSIPENTEVSTTPDNLAITEDGQLVAVQRPDRVAGLQGGLEGGNGADSAPLGSSAPLGNSANVLGNGARLAGRRRAAQGAGVVVSGLVLSALALVATSGSSADGTAEVGTDNRGNLPSGVLPAQLKPVSPVRDTGAPVAAPPMATPTKAATTTKPVAAHGPR